MKDELRTNMASFLFRLWLAGAPCAPYLSYLISRELSAMIAQVIAAR
jgi:hypothetical protein